LTRRVRLVFEELTVRTTAAAEGGIDWQAVYASADAGKALQAVRDRVAAFLTRAGVIAEIERAEARSRSRIRRRRSRASKNTCKARTAP
ncbi:hypothetical protein CKW47_20435, partial [Bordetella pertussis]